MDNFESDGWKQAKKEYHENREKGSAEKAEPQPEPKKPEKTSQAEILIKLAAGAELFHTPDDKAYADIQNNGHRETRSIRSKGFRRWLANRFYQEKKGAPNSEAMQSALQVIEGRAHFEGLERRVSIRIAGANGKIYIDIGDDAWRAIEIDAYGWRIVKDPPVRFRRASGMQPLPLPTKGGSAEDLKSFLNIGIGFELVIAWLLAALRDRGPYPILVVSGEQGSAKSTFTTILRSLVDPNRQGKTATCLSRLIMVTCWRSIIFPVYRIGHPIRSVGWPPVAALPSAKCTVTTTKSYSTLVVRSFSMASRTLLRGLILPTARSF
jgi:hypothetical protein